MERAFPENQFSKDDFLTIEEVALALRCSPDTVRRFPKDQAPVLRVGKLNLYYWPYIVAYVLKHCRVGPKADIQTILNEVIEDVLESPDDGVRERSRRRAR